MLGELRSTHVPPSYPGDGTVAATALVAREKVTVDAEAVALSRPS
jgi:hypothetical protein